MAEKDNELSPVSPVGSIEDAKPQREPSLKDSLHAEFPEEEGDLGSWQTHAQKQVTEKDNELTPVSPVGSTEEAKPQWEPSLKDSLQAEFQEVAEKDNELTPVSVGSTEEAKPQWEPSLKDSLQAEFQEVAEKDNELTPVSHCGSAEDAKPQWEPSLKDSLQAEFAEKSDLGSRQTREQKDVAEKDNELSPVSPGASIEDAQSQWEPSLKDSSQAEFPEKGDFGSWPCKQNRMAEHDNELSPVSPGASIEDAQSQWEPSLKDSSQAEFPEKGDFGSWPCKQNRMAEHDNELSPVSPGASIEDAQPQWEPSLKDSSQAEFPEKGDFGSWPCKQNRMAEHDNELSPVSPGASIEDAKPQWEPSLKDSLQTEFPEEEGDFGSWQPCKQKTVAEQDYNELSPVSASASIEDAKPQWEPSLKDSLQAEFHFFVGVAVGDK